MGATPSTIVRTAKGEVGGEDAKGESANAKGGKLEAEQDDDERLRGVAVLVAHLNAGYVPGIAKGVKHAVWSIVLRLWPLPPGSGWHLLIPRVLALTSTAVEGDDLVLGDASLANGTNLVMRSSI